jgi:hypothetical protein
MRASHGRNTALLLPGPAMHLCHACSRPARGQTGTLDRRDWPMDCRGPRGAAASLGAGAVPTPWPTPPAPMPYRDACASPTPPLFSPIPPSAPPPPPSPPPSISTGWPPPPLERAGPRHRDAPARWRRGHSPDGAPWGWAPGAGHVAPARQPLASTAALCTVPRQPLLLQLCGQAMTAVTLPRLCGTGLPPRHQGLCDRGDHRARLASLGCIQPPATPRHHRTQHRYRPSRVRLGEKRIRPCVSWAKQRGLSATSPVPCAAAYFLAAADTVRPAPDAGDHGLERHAPPAAPSAVSTSSASRHGGPQFSAAPRTP